MEAAATRAGTSFESISTTLKPLATNSALLIRSTIVGSTSIWQSTKFSSSLLEATSGKEQNSSLTRRTTGSWDQWLQLGTLIFILALIQTPSTKEATFGKAALSKEEIFRLQSKQRTLISTWEHTTTCIWCLAQLKTPKSSLVWSRREKSTSLESITISPTT